MKTNFKKAFKRLLREITFMNSHWTYFVFLKAFSQKGILVYVRGIEMIRYVLQWVYGC